MNLLYISLFNYWPIICGLSLITETYTGFSYLTILYLFSTLILMIKLLDQLFNPSLILINIGLITVYLIFQKYSLGLNQDLSSLFWILQLYFCYFLSLYFYSNFKVDLDAFVRPILKMGILSSTIGYLQIFLNTRFLPSSIDQSLDPDIFRSPIFGLYRLSGFSLSPNAFGLFTSFVICLAIAYRKELIRSKYKINIFLLYVFPTLILSFSRGSILLLLIIIPFFLFPIQKIIINMIFVISICLLIILSRNIDIIKSFLELNPRTEYITYILYYLNFIDPLNLLFGIGFSDEVLYLVRFSDNFVVEVLISGGVILFSLLIIFCSNIYKGTKFLFNKSRILKISSFYILLSMLFYSSLNLVYFSTIPLFIIFYGSHYITSTKRIKIVNA